jgi:pimeloyl-ACP methyl ester carboxylesterase
MPLDTGSGVLAATLELPAGCGPFPVALIHAGSGPTDRNGNSAALPGPNDSLKLLAEALAQRQIASVRFDKRGIAASAPAGPASERAFRFSVLVDDTVRWLRTLTADPRFAGVVMIGHSEGALIGMLAASSVPVRGFVSLAGPGQRAGASLREQLARQLNGPLLTRANETIAELEAGREVAEVPSVLAALFRPSVQPYLIDWLTHDPVRILAALSAPSLVVQGTTDLQVSVDDARRLAAARPDVQLVMVPGMNHVLKLVDGNIQAQLPSYSDPKLPLPAPMLTAVSDFIARVSR